MVQTNPTLKKIDLMAPASGRARKEDDTVVNYADMIEAIYKALVVDKNAGVILGEGNELSVELEEGTLVGLTPGTEVGLVDGVKVDLVSGAEVALVDGTEVDLATGAEVALVTGTEVDLVTGAKVGIVGNTLVEQKTQANAVDNVITFSQNIEVVEIFHAEETWQTFIVNGISMVIPSGGYRTPIGGAPATTVTIPADVNCIVGRLV